MSWKEFFKPNWKKILIFVFLAFFLGVVLMSLGAHFFTAPGSDCLGCGSPEILIKITQFSLPLGIGFLDYLGGNLLTFFIITLLYLVFWYSVSCSIFWISNKVRKKK